MKKLYFLLFGLAVTFLSYGQTTDLLISKYGEGSSNNKFLEIYNGTGADVNLDDYAFPNVSNAPSTPGEYEFWNTFPAGTMLADGDVFVIAHGSADPIILAAADMTFNFLSNGDDGFALVANDGVWNDANNDGDVDAGEMTGFTILDFLGDWQGDPGSGWDVAGVTAGTANHTLTRKSSVCSPNNDWSASAGTDAANSEWIVSDIDTEWGALGSFSGCLTGPVVTITDPSDGSSLPSGTTSVDVVFNAENAPGTATFNITVITNGGTPVVSNDVTSPFTITPTVDGDTFMVTVDLVDGGVLASDTSNFEISFPCDLQVGTIVTTCDNITPATDDTYNVSIDYTGGGTSTYTIDTGGIGTVEGDDPSSIADGTISITGVTEGTDFVVTFTGGTNSGCDFIRSISSPDCDPVLTLPLYEGFDYTVAENLGDQQNWESFNSGDNIVIGGPGGLTYTGLANDMQTGNHISFDGGGAESKIEFTPVDYDTAYASFLLNVSDLSAITDLTDGGYIAALAGSDSGYDARVWVRPEPITSIGGGAAYEISITSLTSGANGAPFMGTYLTGETVLVVMSYQPATATLRGWINPSSLGGAEPTPDFMEIDSNPTMNIDRFVLRQDSTGETPSVLFDELRIGLSWADVTPQTLSNDEFNLDQLAIFPNPAKSGFVTITSSNSDAMNVQVFDILGKQVKNETLTNNTLDVSTLNSGMYLVKITQNNASITKKLVIN